MSTQHRERLNDPQPNTIKVKVPQFGEQRIDTAAALWPPGRSSPTASQCGLAFDSAGGPLVAVCGLHGGAGTSTLAYTLAAQAALESTAAVLVCESDGAAGDISALASTTSPSSLGDLAIELRAGRTPRGFLARTGELRVIATAPRPPAHTDDGAITELLGAARARHGLTVVDVGQLRMTAARDIVAVATHVIWLTTVLQAEHARRVLSSQLVPLLQGRQLLAVRAGQRGRRGARSDSSRALRELAAAHCERLLFIPDHGAATELNEPRTRRTLTAIATFIAQPTES